jgi:putative PIN family toxin of toxin-antitoxin system
MRVVIDTNIVINTLLSPSRKSASFRVTEMCLQGLIEPQFGNALFSEYEDVSKRQNIVDKTRFTSDEITEVVDGLFSVGRWHKVHFLWRPNLRDEGDNHLIDLAVASNADYLISYNLKDLMSGDLKFDFEVLTPEDFLKAHKMKRG